MGLVGLRHQHAVSALTAAALAPSTAEAYRRVWAQVQLFTRRTPVNVFPMSVSELADFLGARFEAGCSSATLASAASAIAYGHRIRGLENPTSDFRIHTLLAGAKRLRPGQDRRLAVSIGELKRLSAALDSVPLDPVGRAAARAAFSLAFFAMLRPSEVSLGSDGRHTIRVGNVHIRAGRMEVVIPSSKTSVDPSHIWLVARPDVSICPVAAMANFLAVRGNSPAGEVLFIDGQRRPFTSRMLTRIIKQAGRIARLDPARLSGHCFRIGGASHGAALGMSEMQLAQAGRWTSVTAMRRYVRRSVSLLGTTPADRTG